MQTLKTLSQKPKKTIFVTGRVASVDASKPSSSGKTMVTQFTLTLNGPASSEAPSGVRAYFIWNPAWFRPGFDIVQLSTEIDKLDVLADQGDADAAEMRKALNAQLFVAANNVFADETKQISTLRGLIGGRSKEENAELWQQVSDVLTQLGAENPYTDDDAQESAAQDAIINGVDKFFAEFFGDNGPGGKYVAFTYGHQREYVKDADGNFVIGEDGKRVVTPSKYRNILKWELPTAQKLASWRKSCNKGYTTSYAVDDNNPFGDGVMAA